MLRTHSLRTRLVALTLLLLATAFVAVGLVTALAVQQSLISRLDGELRQVSRFSAQDFGHGQPENGGGSPPDNGGPPPDLIIATVANGQVTQAEVRLRGQDGGENLPSDDASPLLTVAPGDPVTVDLPTLGSYRVVAITQTDGTVQVIGLPAGQLQRTMVNLVTTEAVVAAFVLIIAGVVGAVLVRRELQPLERVAATARQVSTLPLDRGEVQIAERVSDADPNTEVGQLGAALNRMLGHVGAALEARQESESQLRQFVADASHELRTPLAAIRGYAELSRRGPLSAEAAHALSRISSQADRMTTLVEDLLLLARLDAGRPLERSEVDLTRLVLDAVSDAHAVGPDHRWRLDLPEEPVTVTGDASRLTQVLTNLLANARTHTPPGTVVTVTLAQSERAARVSVVDEGPGIPPELLPHVFERFARGSTSRSRENGSTGLGLAIVHAVVAAHGGDVRVTSKPGRTEFSVALPFSTAAAEPSRVVVHS